MAASKKWKDITTHSQGSKDRTPSTYERQVGEFRIVVSRHIHAPGKWVLRSPYLFEKFIDDCPAEEAHSKAEALLREYLETALKAL